MDPKQLAEIVQEVVKELRRQQLVAEESATYELPPEAQKLADSNHCLWCKESLGDGPKTRGLHRHCHRALLRDLEKRGLTIEWAVSIGAALPEGKRGPKMAAATRLDELLAKAANKPTGIDAEHAARLASITEKAKPYTAKPTGKQSRKKNTG
jgi:hypothetical protein